MEHVRHVVWDADVLIKRLEVCASIRNDIERLSAFDNLCRSLDLETADSGSVVPAIGKWNIRHETNPMDDSQSVFLSISSQGTSSLYGDPQTLIIRVRSYETEIFVVWGEYVQTHSPDYDEQWALVTSRIGKGTPQTLRWSLSEDSQATFLPQPVVPFLRQLADADSLAIQTTIDGKTTTAIFDTSGARDALQPVAKAGGWKL